MFLRIQLNVNVLYSIYNISYLHVVNASDTLCSNVCILIIVKCLIKQLKVTTQLAFDCSIRVDLSLL